MKKVAKFEKVSEEQFIADYMNEFGGSREYIEKIYENIQLPRRATKGSAGHDFRTTVSFVLQPGETIKIPTGIRCKIDEGYKLDIIPRSSIGFKYSIILCNTIGLIDEDYYYEKNEGHIFIKLKNLGYKVFSASEGERICQGTFTEFGVADEEEVTETRNGGIGSTGKE